MQRGWVITWNLVSLFLQTLDVKLNGLTHVCFNFLPGCAGCNAARQVGRVC